MDPREIHQQAEIAREKTDFLEALKLTDQATLAYQHEKDYLGLAEIQSSRFHIFKLLYQQTDDINFMVLAKYAAISAVEIAEKSGIKEALAISYVNLGQTYEILEDYNLGFEFYQKGVDHLIKCPPPAHGLRPAMIADFKIHAFTCKHKSGDKSVLDQIYHALDDLEKAEEDSYNKNVWLSGGYIRLAEILKTDQPDKAKKYLQKAKEIINSDSRLKIRLFQWEQLAQTFN